MPKPLLLLCAGAATLLAGAASAACFIEDTTVVCGNGVVIGHATVSVMLGGRSLAPGTGDFVTPDGREVYLLPKGIVIGGSDRIERLPRGPRPAAPP